MNSTRSKPSTELDTDTKKNSRWFRLRPSDSENAEFDTLMDLYWGGPERRITGITLRIVAVNAAALIILLIGILYLGQYQHSLIEAKLETFGAEVELVAAAISEGATAERSQSLYGAPPQRTHELLPVQSQRMVRRLGQTMHQRIYLFGKDGQLIADSKKLTGPDGTIHIADLAPPDQSLYSVQILKSMAAFILRFLPDRRVLPRYVSKNSGQAEDYPTVTDSLAGDTSIAAWNNDEGRIFLSAATPITKNNEIIGAVLLTREGHDIEQDIGEVWINVLKAFLITFLITALLSIYLSGVIARPLRKLANAAEAVRRGKSKDTEIPDLSSRNDEIGELSVVLREMTHALWNRMDTIEAFAADVAHELKNPLTSLRSAVETVEIVKKQKDREKLLEIIKHDIERLDRLITDISSASRLDAELSRENFRPVSLRGVLHDLVNVYKDPLERKNSPQTGWSNETTTGGIHIVLNSKTGDDIHVWGLETRLTQVFENLLANALSFSPKRSTVFITVKPLRKRVAVTIEDQGPGIPENKLENIFERFYSERPEYEDYGKHSGLGLSICKQIVSALGGKIFAENAATESGKVTGARFTVILNKV